ncbi:TPA: hypothetical protein NJ493_004505 [Vibrio parahaemolyticus]|uniref:hypothetical protein n=1 Tax=Vibrio parahaemolyticus TaxID=670 RepID=UPI00111D742F|nr:hypothetical protein [Vibrio parahaemolyticus]MBM4987295.1 hypothetical protein [Vibrio parahaemolyticus]MCG6508370.1 hypothetical protein [Vibrio parahaemolyticus]TOI34232.1 hypothetical protein CGI61_23735 [Vibrio parahaemolyticus]HCE2112494.1 hypothetical protein [Vibrio parahaemolyticus]HCE2442132.1 hypothetical protein [Vibrio parahaemolyticus]
MNIFLIISGFLGLLTVIGHFIVGQKQFLSPMLDADIEPVAKNVMHSVFHYVSVFLVFSTFALLVSGFGLLRTESAEILCLFIGVNYLLFAVWQILIALKSGLEKPLLKLFQWVFFVLISGFALMGSLALQQTV